MQPVSDELHSDRSVELAKSLSQQGGAEALAPRCRRLRTAALNPGEFHVLVVFPPGQRNGAAWRGKRAVFGSICRELVENQRQHGRELGSACKILAVKTEVRWIVRCEFTGKDFLQIGPAPLGFYQQIVGRRQSGDAGTELAESRRLIAQGLADQ